MRIVIDAIPLLGQLTGVGHSVYHLLTEFQRLRPDLDYTYFYGYFSRKLRFSAGDSGDFHQFVKELIKKNSILSGYARDLKSKVGRLQLRNYDLYFEPNFIPLDIRAKKTVTTVYDFSFHLYPEWHPKERVDYFSKHFFPRIHKSDFIITISNYVAREAQDILKLEEARIKTIYLGCDPIFKRRANDKTGMKLPENYLLFVGSLEPRKNLVTLLKAFALLPDPIKREFKLLLAGFKGWENAEILGLLSKVKGSVEYLGYVSSEDLVSLYRSASCFVYPSLYEGFGLPPLEAMACGCPVIVSNAASLPEVCGDAAYYIDPRQVDSLAEGIYRVIGDDALRQDLIRKGLERAKLFSWERTAEEHLKLFEEALDS
jgi:glycosyltransferase involved in cell wall biosynthesis